MARWTLRRRAARIVLLNDRDEILLLRAHDPSDATRAPWWEIPGGGIDGDETSAEGATRELYEETGIRAEVGPCIWRQHNVFDFGGLHFDQDEYIHLARCPSTVDFRPTHLEWLEAQAFEGHRWWGLDDLLASDEPVLPPRLREFLPAVVAGEIPDPPLDIGTIPLDGPLDGSLAAGTDG
jgi:8-oxo-dGTP pyrophosphatase MutT (NUDIX family)